MRLATWRAPSISPYLHLRGERRHSGPYLSSVSQLKLTVGSGIEDVVSNPVRPIRAVHYENSTDRLADSRTGLRFLSK